MNTHAIHYSAGSYRAHSSRVRREGNLLSDLKTFSGVVPKPVRTIVVSFWRVWTAKI